MKKQTIFLFGLFFMYLFVIFQIVPVTYAINDDVAMRDIASGAITGSPDGHLIYIKYALGYVISRFFVWFPGIDWYGCFSIGIVLLCVFLILWRVNDLFQPSQRGIFLSAVLSCTIFTMVWMKHLFSFQYTVIAGITIGTAIFIYATRSERGRRRAIEGIIVLILIWLSFSIRTKVFFMAVPFGGLVFLLKDDSIKEKIGMAVVALAGIAGILVIENVVYSGADWDTYLEYNQYRTDIFDYYGVPSYEENKEFYNSIGMEEYDVANLERYNLYFIEDLETEKMKQVADYAKKIYSENTTACMRMKKGFRCAVKGFFEKQNLVLNFMAKFFLFLIIFVCRSKKKSFWASLGFLTIEAILWLWLGYQGRLPSRIGTALLSIELLSAFGIFCQSKMSIPLMNEKKQWMKGILICICLILTAGQLIQIQKRQEESYRNNSENEKLLHYFLEHREEIYFVPTLMTAGYAENFYVKKETVKKNDFSLGGWTCFSPLEKKALQYYGVTDVDKAFIELDNVYLLLVAPSSKIENHYKECYQEIKWKIVDEAPIFQSKIPVYQVRTEGKKNDRF